MRGKNERGTSTTSIAFKSMYVFYPFGSTRSQRLQNQQVRSAGRSGYSFAQSLPVV